MRRYRKTISVAAVVRVVIKRFTGAFHISELKREVWKVMADANENTIGTAVWNLVHKFGLLESPRPYFYQLRKQ